MIVSGNDTVMLSRAGRLSRLRDGVSPLVPALYGAGVVGWVVLLGIWFLVDRQIVADWLLVLIAGVSLLALVLPRWVLGISAEIEQLKRLVDGEAALVTQLQRFLDNEWTLYRNIKLRDGGRVLTVLVGAGRFYLLHLVGSADTIQNSDSRWLRRDAAGDWQLWAEDPTADALDMKAGLSKQIGLADCLARIVWCGEGILLTDAPAIPVWQLNMTEPIWDELISAETNDKSNIENLQIHERINAVFSS